MKQLREELHTLALENERLDGLAVAAENRAQELQRAKWAAEAELAQTKGTPGTEQAKMQAELLKATDQAKQVFEKLAEERAAHATEISTLRQELVTQTGKVHELELDLVRAKAIRDAQNAKTSEPPQPDSKRSGRGRSN